MTMKLDIISTRLYFISKRWTKSFCRWRNCKLPKETTKTKDITGGLPRVAELFEARKAKDSAIIAENDGQVVFGKEVRKTKVSIVSEDGSEPSNYLIPRGKHINFTKVKNSKRWAFTWWSAITSWHLKN